MHRSIRWLLVLAIIVGLGSAGFAAYWRHANAVHPKTGEAILTPGPDANATMLFNGWRITPAGRHIATGDMLLGGAISPDKKTLAICNAGYSAHALHLIDIASEKEIAKLTVGKA